MEMSYPKRLGDERQDSKLPVQTAGEKSEEGQQDKNLLIEKIGKCKDISNKCIWKIIFIKIPDKIHMSNLDLPQIGYNIFPLFRQKFFRG